VSVARDEMLARCVAWFAEHGVGDTSLRTLATEVGTSHRMLIYHFGSREGLLAAVVETVEQGERDVLQRFLRDEPDPYAAGLRFWEHVADSAATFAPLYFELAGQAMQGRPWAAGLRDWLTDGWTDALTELWTRLGRNRGEAAELARVNLAAVRGLLFDLALTGDRAAADAGMRLLGERFDLTPAPSPGGGISDALERSGIPPPGRGQAPDVALSP
jgi:AcrR family transcriptional regulator